jgi:hypothetical protein
MTLYHATEMLVHFWYIGHCFIQKFTYCLQLVYITRSLNTEYNGKEQDK